MMTTFKHDEDVQDFLRESNAVEGIYDQDSLIQAHYAWEYLMTEKKLNHGVLTKTHKILMLNQPGLRPNEVGYFREIPVYIGGTKEALNPAFIRISLTGWLQSMNKKATGNDAEKEAISRMQHIEYEYIHPFVDGNGRTGRMFMNWYRINRCELPILVIKESERHDYYKWFR